MRSSFVLYTDITEQIFSLDLERRGLLLTAIMAYETDQEVPDLDPATGMLFSLIRTRLDRDAGRYEETCKRRAENARKRWHAENLASMQVDAIACKSKEVHATSADNENDYENDNDNENENDNEKHIKPKARKRAEVVYDPDPEVNEAVKQFVRHRRILKKPMTDYAVDRFLAKLRGLSGDPTEQVRLINNAIEHGWQTVYEDKKPEGKIDWSAV